MAGPEINKVHPDCYLQMLVKNRGRNHIVQKKSLSKITVCSGHTALVPFWPTTVQFPLQHICPKGQIKIYRPPSILFFITLEPCFFFPSFFSPHGKLLTATAASISLRSGGWLGMVHGQHGRAQLLLHLAEAICLHRDRKLVSLVSRHFAKLFAWPMLAGIRTLLWYFYRWAVFISGGPCFIILTWLCCF